MKSDRIEPTPITPLSEYRAQIGALITQPMGAKDVANALRRLSAEIRAIAWFPRDNALNLAALADAEATRRGDTRGPLRREDL